MNCAEIVTLANVVISDWSLHNQTETQLATAVIEMAQKLEQVKARNLALTAGDGTVGARYAFLESLAGPEYSPVVSKPVEAFIAERIERLEQQVAEGRRLIADAVDADSTTNEYEWYEDAKRFLAATAKGAEAAKR